MSAAVDALAELLLVRAIYQTYRPFGTGSFVDMERSKVWQRYVDLSEHTDETFHAACSIYDPLEHILLASSLRVGRV